MQLDRRYGTDKPLRVKPLHGMGGVAIVMPIRTGDDT